MPEDRRPDRRGMTIREMCRREGIDRSTCWRWIEKGVLVVDRIGPRTGVRVRYQDDQNRRRGDE